MKAETCQSDSDHDWRKVYDGNECVKCGMFYAFGCAPWEEDYDFESDEELY